MAKNEFLFKDYFEQRMTGFESKLQLILDKVAGQTGYNPEEHLCRKEVAMLFKLSLSTVDKLAKDGFLKRYKLGRRTFFIRREIDEGLKQCQKKY